jgi:tellurite resistance protein TehA-like permease
MQRPPFVRYLYNRWVFLAIGLAGLGNIFLLVYRFAVLGFLSYVPEHLAAGLFSLVTCLLAFGMFVDLSLKNPDRDKR